MSIASSFRVSPATVGRVICETQDAMWNELLVCGFLTVPHTHAEWNQIARDFEEKWNCPPCFGAINGKHVIIGATTQWF